MKIYNKYKKPIEYFIYPLALLVLPLINCNQGVDVSDSMYSLGNYLFADSLSGMWVISTFLSNAFGAFIMKLPGAQTLMVANIYTSLVLAITGLIVYFVLRQDFDSRYVFLGEFAAICFCWIPKSILYNYMSYLLMVVGALLLYKGILKASWKYYLLAGFVLGANVFVRIPNVTQMALIVVLWFAAFILGRKWVKDTFICIGGYALGVGVACLCVVARFGLNGIVEAISGLSGITSTDETYTPLSMITGSIKAYILSFKWAAIIVLVVVCGCIMYKVLPGKLTKLKTAVYIGVIVLMIRFFWGRGMFSFRYYEDYTSMYEWGIVALYLSIIVDIVYIVRAVKDREYIRDNTKDKQCSPMLNKALMAVISLVIIVIAPLGSNNNLYQNLNNLYLVMPFTMYAVFEAIKLAWTKKDYTSIPVAVMLYTLLACILVQSFGFSQSFVFRDGMRGEKRDTKITAVACLKGMYTNEANAKAVTGVCEYIGSLSGVKEIITFGDCPGFTYILGMPSALYSSWIDLDSNPINQLSDELDTLKNDSVNIPVIIRKQEGFQVAFANKEELIYQYIEDGGYKLSYENEEYKVYIR